MQARPTTTQASEPAIVGDDGAALSTAEQQGAAADRSESSRAMRGLFGRDSMYIVLWGLQLFFAALITPVATRLLSSGEFGRMVAATAVMQVLVAIGSVSLQQAVQRHYHENGERDARRLITLAMLLSGLTFAVAYLTGPAWTAALRLGTFHGAVRYAVEWASMTAISNAALGWIRSRDRLWVFAAVSLIQSVVAALLSLALVAFVHATASEFLLGQFLGQLLAVIVALSCARPLLIRRSDFSLVGRALRYSGALVPASIAAFGLNSADRLVVQHDLGSTLVARYSIAYNIGAIPVILVALLDTAWMPRIFALSSQKVRNVVLMHSRDAILALLIPTLVGLSAGAPLLLAAWAPPSYHPYSLLLVLALVSATAFPLSGTMAALRVLLVSGRTWPVGVWTVVSSLVTVAITIALVPPLGLDGAALATVLGFSLQSMLLGRAAQSVQPIARPPAGLLVKCAAALLLAGVWSQLPVDAPFLVARALVAALCLLVFAAVAVEMVAPGSRPALTRIARRLNVRQPG